MSKKIDWFLYDANLVFNESKDTTSPLRVLPDESKNAIVTKEKRSAISNHGMLIRPLIACVAKDAVLE